MRSSARGKLILIRHGQSEWNKENRFTGLIDIDLSLEGVAECKQAAQTLRQRGCNVLHIAFTSQLRRAWRSLQIILDELSIMIPVVRSSALNERYYGKLQGMNKDEARRQFGEDNVHRWRRGIYEGPPGGESFMAIYKRVILFFEHDILPEVERGHDVLVVGHSSSVRALVMYLENLDESQIERINIPNAMPLFY